MITVIKSPWPDRLPNGTEIIPTEPRPGKKRDYSEKGSWFKRKDGQLLFDSEKDGKFKLYSDEFKEE